jgi:hypothetical protein
MSDQKDPKLMILEMLSEGKIRVDQAEALLKAIKDDSSASKRGPEIVIDPIRTGKLGRAIEKAMKNMPDIAETISEAFEEVGETLSASIGSMLEDVGMKGGEQVVEVPTAETDDTRIEIKHGGGSLSLIGVEGKQVKIIGGRRRCKVEGNSVSIISGGGSATIELPRRIHSVDVKVGGGNLTVENLDGDLSTSAAGGNLTLVNIYGQSVHGSATGGNVTLRDIHQASSMKFRAAGGNVKAELGTINAGQIELNSYGGGVELKLAANSAFNVSIDSFGGDAYSEFELQDVKTEGGSFKGKYNNGGASISLSAKGGDARLLPR